MRLPRFLRTTTSAILLVSLLLAVIAAAAVLAARAYEDRLGQVRHTIEVQRRLTVVLSTMQDAETGQRGYLLTGDPTYLQPYDVAKRRLSAELADLEAAVADNPVQQQTARALRPLVSAKFRELERTIALGRDGRVAEALDVVRGDEGRVIMDRLRQSIATMAAREETLLRERTEASRRYSYGLFGFLTILVVVVFVSLLAWLIQSRRYGRALEASNREAVETANRLRVEVAERAQAESQVRQLQKMEAIGQLTGGIAHDFNNMLAVIIGNIELARRHIDHRERLQARLGAALEGAVKAATLTKRLLAFSRQQPLEPQALDLNRLVSGLSDMLLRTLGETIQVETILAGGLWRTHLDPGQVENAILNLVVNARDAMPSGGKLTVETGNAHLDDAYAAQHLDAKAGQYAMIAVTDTGEGMTPDVVAKAFEPFFTTKGVGKGTGLGLSQIYGFIKQSGGHVRIYSEPGKGTTVKLYLPRHYGTDLPAEPSTLALDDTIPHGSLDEIILVVEDEENLRHVSVESLRSLGYTVRHAADGESALKLLADLGAVHLLFTDIVMPGMTGRQLADAAGEMHPGLKVLYTTGYTRNAVVHNGVVDPGVAFLAKPFTVDQLAAKVRAVLQDDEAVAAGQAFGDA